MKNSTTEKTSTKKFKNSEKELNNFEKTKTNKFSQHKKEEKNSTKKINKPVIKKIYTAGNILIKSKKSKNTKKENNFEEISNKLDDNISKNEKMSLFLDRNHDTSSIKMININNNIQEKNNNCNIF